MQSGSVRVVQAAFAAIAALLVLLGAVGLLRAERARSQAHAIAATALERVELESRLARDVDQIRLLVDVHIFEKEQTDMDVAEQRIAALEADFASASRQYDRVASRRPDAEAIWRGLRRQVADSRPLMVRTLARSRTTEDPTVIGEYLPLEARFDAIDSGFTRLTAIGRTDADNALQSTMAIEHESALLQIALLVMGVVLSVILGVWAVRAVAERDAAARQYAFALEERNRELDAFAGRVAHDLRGPLNSIGLGLSREVRGAAEGEAMAAIVRRAVVRMDALIGDLLTLSRAGAEARGGESDLGVVAARLREDLASRDLGGAMVRFDVEPGRVACRETLLRQAVWNLVENGAKYHRENVPAEVRVVGRARGDEYELRVEDNGMGMTPDESRQVFAPFYRAPGASNRPGTGLGLSIVKRVVEACGGGVRIESSPGRGTTFVMRLPCAHAD